MIYNNDIEIPDICPLYFGGVREPVFFYKQENYIPKMTINTPLILWISKEMYDLSVADPSQNFTLKLFDGKNRDISLFFSAKILVGYDETIEQNQEYYYIETVIDFDIIGSDNKFVSFEVYQGEVKLADTCAYELSPPYTADLKVITFTNRINDYNTLFYDGVNDDTFNYAITIEGGFDVTNFITEGRSKSFQNQLGYSVLLSAMPIDKETFIIGDVFGIPNWLISLLSRLMCLSYFTIDGEEFSKFEDSEIERVNSNGGLSQYKIELQSKDTSTNKTFDNSFTYPFE